jgi:tripartite-type tricarboxylate transporter receptor subunit TctC
LASLLVAATSAATPSRAAAQTLTARETALVAPKGTAKPIIDLLANETIKAARSPEMAKRLVAEGSEAAGTTPAEFTAHLRAEHAMWSKVIKEGGIKGE